MVNKRIGDHKNSDSRREIYKQRLESFRYIGYTPHKSSCTHKMKFEEIEAKEAARDHTYQYACPDMQAYWCRKHWIWHIGHGDRYRAANSRLQDDIRWFQWFEWYSRN